MKENAIIRFGPYLASGPTRLNVHDAVCTSLRRPARQRNGMLASASAILVVSSDGGSLRSVLTGRRVIPTGFLTSRKTGRAMPFEGMNEAALLKYCEVDTRVVDYLSQPFRFEFVLDGAKRIYIADCARVLDDGTLEVIEVKGEHTRLGDPDYAAKLERVSQLCAELGWRFRLVTRRQMLGPKVVFANVDFIQSRRQVMFDEACACRAIEHLERAGGEASLGRLAEFWGGWQKGLAALQAMMVRRWLAIDVTAPISPESFATILELAPATLLGRGGQ